MKMVNHMNLFLKKYFGIIVTSIILLMFLGSTFYSLLKYDQDYEEIQKEQILEQIRIYCDPIPSEYEELCASFEETLKDVSGAHFLDNYDGGKLYQLLAGEEGVIDEEYETERFYDEFSIVLTLLIAVSSIYLWHMKKKKGRLKNEFVRISYQKWFRNNYFVGALIAIIPILFLVIAYILCYVVTKTLPSSELVPYGIHFLTLFLFALGIYHLALIADRKSKNFFLTMIIFFTLLVLCYIGNSLIGRLVFHIGWTNYPELGDIFTFSYFQTADFYFPLFMVIFFSLITFGIVCLCYKNKERLLIDSERN